MACYDMPTPVSLNLNLTRISVCLTVKVTPPLRVNLREFEIRLIRIYFSRFSSEIITKLGSS